MALLSPDECTMLINILNQLSLKGEEDMRKVLPLFDKLHDGASAEGIPTSHSVKEKKEKEDIEKGN